MKSIFFIGTPVYFLLYDQNFYRTSMAQNNSPNVPAKNIYINKENKENVDTSKETNA